MSSDSGAGDTGPAVRTAAKCSGLPTSASCGTDRPVPSTSATRMRIGNLPFPVQLQPLLRMIADLVQRLRVEQAAVHHHHGDRFAVADVLERIAIEHAQGGPLPFLH